MYPSNTEFDYISADNTATIELITSLKRSMNSHTGVLTDNHQRGWMLDEWGNIGREFNIARAYNQHLSRRVHIVAETRGGKGIASDYYPDWYELMESIAKQKSTKNDIDYDMI